MQYFNKDIIGIYVNDRKEPAVLPISNNYIGRIKVKPDKICRHGDMVKVKLQKENYNKRTIKKGSIRAQITEKIKGNEDNIDLLYIRTLFQLPESFPRNVRREIKNYKLPKDEFEQQRRIIDKEWIVTIDSEEAKDLDDAVSVSYSSGRWYLGVYIADVTRYVPKDSNIELEAMKRASSIYFGSEVIPMFPEFLSNDLCSLVPGKEKSVLCCLMEIDNNGTVLNYDIFPGIIKINERLSYNMVNNILNDPNDLSFRKENLKKMWQLMEILKNRRLQDGSIDFDIDEIKILKDSSGKVIEIKKQRRGIAERIIEEFMLVANKTVAHFIAENKVPAIYRIHDIPDILKVKGLNHLINSLNLPPIDINGFISTSFQNLLFCSKNKPSEQIVTYFILRSMQQAKYCTDNRGHFGLGFTHYVHFTSPIRRFPDFVIHRIVKNILNKRDKTSYYLRTEKGLERISEHCTQVEKKAAEIERTYLKIKEIRWLKQQPLKKVWDGIITGITKKGVFVELLDLPIDGLILMEDLQRNERFDFNEKKLIIKGQKSKKIYKLGSFIKVSIKKIDTIKFLIDFTPV